MSSSQSSRAGMKNERRDITSLRSDIKRQKLDNLQNIKNNTTALRDEDSSSSDYNNNNGSDSSDEENDAPLPADRDGYVEGSIVRIILKDFVTYDYCEIEPGPQMNMIIGPNGTGKSTIVCAIALGLGGSPSLLGRAKNITEFIKTGADEATIQIELKRTRERNVVIQRTIQKSSKSTPWKIDNKTTTHKEVLSTIARLNIQVDNLCQFLPQDKVSEFAQLTPSQLLEKTQEAAGKKNMSRWLQQLIEWRQTQKTLQKSHEGSQMYLKTLMDRNAGLEKDVFKLKQREAALNKVAILKAMLPLAKYSEAKTAYDEAKEDEKSKKDQLQALEDSHRPLQIAVNRQERESASASNTLAILKDQVKQHAEKLVRDMDNIDKSKQTVLSARSEIEGLKRREEQRKADTLALENKIAYAKEKLGPEPAVNNTDEINKTIEDINIQLSQCADKTLELRQKDTECSRKKNENINEIAENKKELAEMQNIQERRLRNLRQTHEDTYKGFQWLRANRSMFKGRIYGPIQLAVNVKNEQYASIVETVLGGEKGSHLRTFVCEYQEDYQLFTRETIDKLNLKLTVSWPGEIDAKSIQPLMSEEKLKKEYNMDHFVVNLLDGPPLVLKYLCQQSKIHLIPVTINQCSQEKIVNSDKFKKFIIKSNLYEVNKYSYGKGGRQTAIRMFKPATILADSINNELKQNITKRLSELEAEATVIQETKNDITRQRETISQKENELRHEKESQQALKKDVNLRRNRWQAGKMEIESMEEDLILKKSRPDKAAQDIKRLETHITSEVIARAKLSSQYKTSLQSYVDTVIERNSGSLTALYFSAKYEAIKQFSRLQMKDLSNMREMYTKAIETSAEKKKTAHVYFKDAERAGNDLKEELLSEFREIFEKWKISGLDENEMELEDAINSESAKADAIKASNPRAMENYENRLAEIDKYTAKVNSDKHRLDELSKKIETVKLHWEPRLNKLVSRINAKFSEAFQRIDCVGEVCVSPHEDFDKWGIEIRVKFRGNEKLQLLTGQRQSGGERAVSTILYLMSLQALAKAPFRTVDEINQGMDQRNERMIHEEIVREATKSGTAQYFLITPKLLSDLYYNDRMRVLCIYNGEWLPTQAKPAYDCLQSVKDNLISG
ncbi:hypothetical protein BDF14DRAFT_1755553 [Spinellus fusiger]|nr:hypothetical protein BDF14DRAFT_1755553 [Spinellus fusiger]